MLQMGESTVKWTTPYLFIVLNESDSKLSTNFKICEDIF